MDRSFGSYKKLLVGLPKGVGRAAHLAAMDATTGYRAARVEVSKLLGSEYLVVVVRSLNGRIIDHQGTMPRDTAKFARDRTRLWGR